MRRFAGILQAPETSSKVSYRPRMAEGHEFESHRVHLLFLLFAGKNLRESYRSRTLLLALCSNAARTEARTRLLHSPKSRAAIVAFTLSQGFECPKLHRQKPSYKPAQCITIHRRNM